MPLQSSLSDQPYNRQLMSRIRNRTARVAVMGMNAESLALASGLSTHFRVTLYDGSEEYIQLLQCGIDPFGKWEVASFNGTLQFTSQKGSFPTVDVFILAMETTAADGLSEDVTSLRDACRTIAAEMKKGSSIVFEKNVRLKSMECFCLPMLEKLSGLEFGKDFNMGFVNSATESMAFEDINSAKLWHSHKSIEPAINALYSLLPVAEQPTVRSLSQDK